MELKSEVVEFRDGTKLTVTEATWEADMRVGTMELKAQERSKELVISKGENLVEADISWMTFFRDFYPKLAACSTGNVPTEEEAYNMPSEERDKWYAAAHNVNPLWFKALDAVLKSLNTSEKEQKKKRRSR
jgi:hypothetical protein